MARLAVATALAAWQTSGSGVSVGLCRVSSLTPIGTKSLPHIGITPTHEGPSSIETTTRDHENSLTGCLALTSAGLTVLAAGDGGGVIIRFLHTPLRQQLQHMSDLSDDSEPAAPWVSVCCPPCCPPWRVKRSRRKQC